MTVPGPAFSYCNDGMGPPPPPPDFSSVEYAPDPGLFPALMPTATSPGPLKLRVSGGYPCHALLMPAAEILQFHTN